MANITVTRIDDDTFSVEVRERSGSTTHEVRCTAQQARRFGGDVDVEFLVRRSFEFLLEHEPKESILRRFELPVIERYFPRFPAEIARRMAR